MNKKILAVLLCVCLSFMMFSCSGNTDSDIEKKKLLTNEDWGDAYYVYDSFIHEDMDVRDFSYFLEFEDQMEDRSSFGFYHLMNHNERVFQLVSEIKDNVHTAYLIFNDGYLSWTENKLNSERFLTIAARLLSGRFESDDIIWKTFSEEYGTVNTVYTDHDVDVSAENHPPQRTAVWSREINGIICEVETQQPDINEDAEYIKIIRLIEK